MTTYHDVPADLLIAELATRLQSMDQVSAPEVAELFEDGKFLKWYKKEYNVRTERDDTPQEEWLEGYNKWKTKKERCPHN